MYLSIVESIYQRAVNGAVMCLVIKYLNIGPHSGCK